jgi:hypothetical protein
MTPPGGGMSRNAAGVLSSPGIGIAAASVGAAIVLGAL